MKLIRSDHWQLSPTTDQREYLERTEALYRSYAQALMGVVYTHWLDISNAKSQCAAVEELIHQTTRNPNPRYGYFSLNFKVVPGGEVPPWTHRPKFPSYLRRAVIQAVVGQVSSFVTRYNRWQGGMRSKRGARPPGLTSLTNLHVVLYQGQCIKFHESCVDLKVYNGSDWVWIKVLLVGLGHRHLLPNAKTLSPHLVLTGKGTYLSVPFQIETQVLGKPERVCSVDLGINKTATASIVEPDGTVTARLFISCAADIDHRDKRLQSIRKKARLTMGKTGKLYKGFCQSTYRKAGNINRQIAQLVSRRLVDWAIFHGASVIVFEDLKGWRPKAGKKRSVLGGSFPPANSLGSTLRQRFHGWLHSLLVKLTEEKFAEVGGQTKFVFARGTSSWAFDGSGQIKRGKTNYSLATFSTGKQYNADLSASYNIGARYWASKNQKLVRRNDNESVVGKSSRTEPRTRVSLSSLWSNPPKTWSKMRHLHRA